MCLPKAMGGLGIRSLHRMNVALLACQGWNLLTDSSSLWVSLCKAKYLCHTTYWESASPRVASWAWRGILQLRPFLCFHVCRQIRDGESTVIWRHPWIIGMPNFKPSPRALILPEWETELVSSLICSTTQQWDRERLQSRFDDVTIAYILRIPLHLNGRTDRWIWSLETNGMFSTKSMYRAL